MGDKIQLILLSYDPERLEIEVQEVQPGGKPVNGVVKGKTVKEFKQLVRSKYGNDVEIVNRIQKKRDLLTEREERHDSSVEDDRYRRKDIMDVMKNKDTWD